MTESTNDYARRAVAFRLLSALAHEMDQHRFQQTLDEVMADRDLRYVVAYLAGLAMERFREANNGDWAAATADIDLNLKLAEDLDGLGG